MKIIILSEGSKEIGFGHITRCISLYEAFQEKGLTPEFVINGDQSVKSLIVGKRFRILNWINENEAFYALLKCADCVIVDSYLISNTLCDKISDTVKVPVFIDFIQKRKYKKGIVIDGSITEPRFIYGHEICYLKGIEYIMLREEFSEIPLKEIRKDIQSVLITLGGSDIRGLMPLIQTVFSQIKIRKTLVIGNGFVNTEEIRSKVDLNTKLVFNPKAEVMKQLMLEADIAISAGGQTLFELARTGTPSIMIGVADNQTNNINYFSNKGFLFAGLWNSKELQKNIFSQFEELKNYKLRSNTSTDVRNIIDGNGIERVLENIFKYLTI